MRKPGAVTKFVEKREMLINTYGAKCIGIDAVKVTVETDICNGIGIHRTGGHGGEGEPSKDCNRPAVPRVSDSGA